MESLSNKKITVPRYIILLLKFKFTNQVWLFLFLCCFQFCKWKIAVYASENDFVSILARMFYSTNVRGKNRLKEFFWTKNAAFLLHYPLTRKEVFISHTLNKQQNFSLVIRQKIWIQCKKLEKRSVSMCCCNNNIIDLETDRHFRETHIC